MNNINENNKILNISFNQDNSCFSISTEKGCIIYKTFPFKKEHKENFGGGIKITEMYYKSNILALLSGGEYPKFNPKKLIIWDISLNKVVAEINIFNSIKNVKMKKDRIYINNESNIYIFDLKTLENIEIIQTFENPKGLFSTNSDENNDVIAFLGEPKEKDNNKKYVYVNIKDYGKSLEKSINTREEMVSYISLNNTGNLVAIANDKGNVIKIYNCANEDLLGEYYRGKEKAEINYICFDKLSNYFAVTSDRGTIHIWSLKKILHKLSNKNNENDKNKSEENKIINKYDDLPENQKRIFSHNEKSFAKIKANSKKSICSFQENNSIVVLTYEGMYYQYNLDTKNGGNCQKKEQKELII